MLSFSSLRSTSPMRVGKLALVVLLFYFFIISLSIKTQPLTVWIRRYKQEISDDLMSALSVLLASGIPSESAAAQQKAFVTYDFSQHSSTTSASSQDYSVTLLESRAVISSSGTTGLRTWEAALLLGSYLSSQDGREKIREKQVLELGAGTGMLSILCAKHLGVSGVVATDGDEAVVDAIKTNSYLNGVDTESQSKTTVKAAALRWGWGLDADTFSEDYGMDIPDVILGADVVSYYPHRGLLLVRS